MPREEYTYTSRRGGEVMVVWDGIRIADIYTYRDTWFLRPHGRRGEYRATDDVARDDAKHTTSGRAKWIRWRAGKNPLFVHASHTGAAYGFLLDHGFTSGNEDPHESA